MNTEMKAPCLMLHVQCRFWCKMSFNMQTRGSVLILPLRLRELERESSLSTKGGALGIKILPDVAFIFHIFSLTSCETTWTTYLNINRLVPFFLHTHSLTISLETFSYFFSFLHSYFIFHFSFPPFFLCSHT